VDADVVDLAAVDLEEHQVAALQFSRLDGLCFLGLATRSARHVDSEMMVRIEDEPAAVETIGRRAAKSIAHAAQAHGVIRERVAAILDRLRTTTAIPVFLLNDRGRRRNGAGLRRRVTAREQGSEEN